MKASLIALAVFAVNAAYVTSHGKEPAHSKLEDAPEEYRNGLTNAVESFLADPEAKLPTPEGMEGFAAYYEGQSAIFRAVVEALRDVPDPVEPGAVAAPAAPSSQRIIAAPDGQGFTSIKYIGRRPEYRDGTYGTGIVWKQGESKLVHAEKAALMLRHHDVYNVGDPMVEEAPPSVVKKEGESEDMVQQVKDSIATMNKDSVVAYAKSHYGIDFNKKQGADSLRQQLVQLVDQFGVS